jgi:nicotinate-nucleotide adenylyltransferase
LKTIGLYGGSFDPIHKAHLALARTARDALALDEVQFIPARNPWQRAPLVASEQQRAEMISLALGDEGGLRLNTMELTREGATFTIDTVCTLPVGPRYFWMLGADQLANFCTWKRWDDIVDYVELAVACRPGSLLQAPAALSARLRALGLGLTVVPFAPTPVSGSGIRERLINGDPVDDLVPASVCRYIEQHGLYRN